MPCPRCGAPAGPGATFCPRCGAPLTVLRKSRKNLVVLGVALAVVALIFGAVVYGGMKATDATLTSNGLQWSVVELEAITDTSQEPLNYYGNAPISAQDLEAAAAGGQTYYMVTFQVHNSGLSAKEDVSYDFDIFLNATDTSHRAISEYGNSMTGLGIPSEVEAGDTVTFQLFYRLNDGVSPVNIQVLDSSGSEVRIITLTFP